MSPVERLRGMPVDERFRKSVDEALAELRRAEANLERYETALATRDAHALAEALHEEGCSFDHGDHCPWLYETDRGGAGWEGMAHRQWLQRATALLARRAKMDSNP